MNLRIKIAKTLLIVFVNTRGVYSDNSVFPHPPVRNTNIPRVCLLLRCAFSHKCMQAIIVSSHSPAVATAAQLSRFVEYALTNVRLQWRRHDLKIVGCKRYRPLPSSPPEMGHSWVVSRTKCVLYFCVL